MIRTNISLHYVFLKIFKRNYKNHDIVPDFMLDLLLTCPNPRSKASNNRTACQIGPFFCAKNFFKITKSPTHGTHVLSCRINLISYILDILICVDKNFFYTDFYRM